MSNLLSNIKYLVQTKIPLIMLLFFVFFTTSDERKGILNAGLPYKRDLSYYWIKKLWTKIDPY